MYHGDLFPENFDAPENDEKWYPEKDYHTMYIGEILKVLVKEAELIGESYIQPECHTAHFSSPCFWAFCSGIWG